MKNGFKRFRIIRKFLDFFAIPIVNLMLVMFGPTTEKVHICDLKLFLERFGRHNIVGFEYY